MKHGVEVINYLFVYTYYVGRTYSPRHFFITTKLSTPKICVPLPSLVTPPKVAWQEMDTLRVALRRSNKYRSLTRNKFLMKSAKLLWNNMTYIQNTHRFRDFKSTFAHWLKFKYISNLIYLHTFVKLKAMRRYFCMQLSDQFS
jgi:hypothetical protein